MIALLGIVAVGVLGLVFMLGFIAGENDRNGPIGVAMGVLSMIVLILALLAASILADIHYNYIVPHTAEIAAQEQPQ